MNVKVSARFLQIPQDLLFFLLDFLDLTDIVLLGSTCRVLHENLIEQQSVWKMIYIRLHPKSVRNFKDPRRQVARTCLSRRLKQLKHLTQYPLMYVRETLWLKHSILKCQRDKLAEMNKARDMKLKFISDERQRLDRLRSNNADPNLISAIVTVVTMSEQLLYDLDMRIASCEATARSTEQAVRTYRARLQTLKREEEIRATLERDFAWLKKMWVLE